MRLINADAANSDLGIPDGSMLLVPTEAEGRREAYQGFSNASPDSAVTTHV